MTRKTAAVLVGLVGLCVLLWLTLFEYRGLSKLPKSDPGLHRPTPPPVRIEPRNGLQNLPTGVKGLRDVYYATDRAPFPEGTGAFGGQASDSGTLSLGHVVISIPETHERGELERPWKVFSVEFPEDSRRHLLISERHALSSDDLFKGFERDIESSPERAAFVFVHGFNVSFDEALLRTGQLAWDMKFRGPALTYSWPSAGATAKYVSDLDMADFTAPHLADFLKQLRQRTGDRTIHLVAHSMGSRVLAMALDRMALVDAGARHHFQEVVMAAPDINPRILSQLSKAIHSEADRVTIYASDRDLALKASSSLRMNQNRAGMATGAASLPAGFDVIDATRAKASLLGHSYFAEDVTLLNDLSILLKQRLGPDQRSITLDRSGPIWVFRP